MKKRLQLMNDEGYYVTYVLVAAFIVLSIIATATTIYSNERKSTFVLLEQLESDTLVQMARVQFRKDEMHKNSESGQVTYDFPNGTATIWFNREKDDIIFLDMTITTESGSVFRPQAQIGRASCRERVKSVKKR